MKQCADKVCNFCEGAIDNIASYFPDLPRCRALSKAIQEFEEYHDRSSCLDFYVCSPILRARTEIYLTDNKPQTPSPPEQTA